MNRSRRRLFFVAAGFGAFALIALLAAPWWLPAGLAWSGGAFGFSFRDWTTHGWDYIELREITYRSGNVQVTANHARVPGFLIWPQGDGETPMFRASSVQVIAEDGNTPRPPDAPAPSLRRAIVDALNAFSSLERWAPSARAEDITVTAGTTSLHLDEVNWDGERVQVRGVVPDRSEEFLADALRESEDTLAVHVEIPTHGLELGARAVLTPGGANFDGDLTWLDNVATIHATVGAEGLLPESAVLDAPAITVEPARLGLPGYAPARGTIHAAWTDGSYTATITGSAEPAAGSNPATTPPIDIDIRARGDWRSVQLESVLLRIPGVNATLTAPLTVTFPELMIGAERPAAFTLDIQLAELLDAPAQGSLTGRVDVFGSPDTGATAGFALAGAGIHWRDAEIPTLEIAGHWQPATLTVERAFVQLREDAYVNVQGQVDLTSNQIVSGVASGRLTAAAIRPWWSKVPEFAEIVLDAQLSGALAEPQHRGTARWRGLAGVPGGAIDGEATWSGAGAAQIDFRSTVVSASGVTLPLAGQMVRGPAGDLFVALDELAWHDTQGEWWRLAQPAHVRMTPAEDGGSALIAADLQATGSEGFMWNVDAALHWPAQGRIAFSAGQIAAARLADWLPAPAVAARLDRIQLQAEWNNGPVAIDGELRATYAPDENASYAVEAEFRTENEAARDRLAFGSVRVLDETGMVLQGEGWAPLHVAGRAEGFELSLPRDGEFALTLESTPNPHFWGSIAQLTRWEIDQPRLTAHFEGSLQAPQGQVNFTIGELRPPSGAGVNIELPRLADLRLGLVADENGLALQEGIVAIEGNWVNLQGRAPWSLWREWRETGTLPWRQAAFSFSADRMPMSIASRSLPMLLSPDGNVSFSMEHEPGRGLSGFLWLSGAGLRPIPPVGTVREIDGEVRLGGYHLELPRLGALIGGRPIEITGEADFAEIKRPTFNVQLTSSRVPLVRQEGLVLRAGMDIRVEQTADAPARISGEVDIGQSVFVSDLVSLLPTGGGVAEPEQRPPYFSVEEEPFANWTLALTVHGDEAVRVENPFFRGTVSADFRLEGTLGEPRAIGRGWTNNGTVIFPFGNLRVEQLEVALTEQNPYEPSLSGSATTRLYGYDLRMEVSGSASEPRLLFTSNPPLSSQQVFLLLTTGEMPTSNNAFSTTDRAQRLAVFLGRNLASSFGLGRNGEGEQRWEVRAGEDFSREGGETYYVQYNLDDRWALFGERDRFDAYNGGIKFRVIDR